jgi:broad specificity phosphatase PhoE
MPFKNDPNIKVETTEDVAEWDYGDYEGLKTAEIREKNADWWAHDQDQLLAEKSGAGGSGRTAARTASLRSKCATGWTGSSTRSFTFRLITLSG